MGDHFKELENSFNSILEDSKKDNLTGCVILGEQAHTVGMSSHYFLINGKDVSKEEYILKSGMEHLLRDQSKVKCTKCGRKKSPEYYKQNCGMSISDEPCTGIFF